MDELELNGRRHISAKRAAKEHRYHSDYIGQLIRANKVIGQKVGRSWYVDAESLDAYLKGEEQPTVAVASAPAPVAVPVPPQPVAAPMPAPAPVQAPEPIAPVQPPVQVVPVVAPVVEPRHESAPVVQAASAVSDMRTVPIARTPETVREPIHYAPPAPTPMPHGLRFVPDEEPVMPIRTMQREMPQTRYEEEEVIITPAPERRAGGYAAIATAGVAMLVLAFASSYILVHHTTVTDEQATAAVSVSVD